MFKKVLRELKHISASIAAASIFVGVLFSPLTSGFGDAAIASSPETSSAKTVAAADYDMGYSTAPMPDLKVSVSQTSNLSSQGLTISWQGAASGSVRPSSDGGANFLQIFQCWGEDPNQPGHPDRTTCQYGANSIPGSGRANSTQIENVDSRDLKFTKPGTNWANPPYTSIPFNSATGETIWDLKREENGQLGFNSGVSMSANRFFSPQSTNEVNWVGSDDNGNGTVKFALQTASESPGLGCGKALRVGKKTVGQSCWLVVLPRGEADNKQQHITKSGLFWDAWKHHIAFKLDFRPIGVRCEIGIPERQVQGDEVATEAFSSWQPKLCGGQTKSAFVFSNQLDSEVMNTAADMSSPALAVTTHAVNDSATDPLVYAPLAISGVSLSFSLDRAHDTSKNVPEDVKKRNESSFTNINLTPRLLAKLLTYSYKQAMPSGANIEHLGSNYLNITQDPEFLEANSDEPDWEYTLLNFGGIADVVSPNTRSFLAEQIWNYVLSDKSAREFLAGQPDSNGMRVNPWFSTSSKVNPSGSGLSLPNYAFPKSDPVEKPDTTGEGGANASGPVNLVTWRPYVSDFEAGALSVLSGNAYELGIWDPAANPPNYKKGAKQPLGRHRVLALSTTPAAEKYQTFQASFLNPAGKFVKPTLASLKSARDAMTPSKINSNLVSFDFASKKAKAAQGAYPLAVPVYAAYNPLQTGESDRSAYSSLIRYAVTDGQTSGTNPGNLPPGYAPLSASMVAQALKAANDIKSGNSPIKSEDNGPLPMPSAEPSQKPVLIAAGDTPDDPAVSTSAAALPAAGAIFICASMFYALLRQRKSRR